MDNQKLIKNKDLSILMKVKIKFKLKDGLTVLNKYWDKKFDKFRNL